MQKYYCDNDILKLLTIMKLDPAPIFFFFLQKQEDLKELAKDTKCTA